LTTPGARRFARAVNCDRIGVLFPGRSSTSRWEERDRPLIDRQMLAALPGVAVEYANANGDPDLQQQQAASMLENGVCMLVLAPQDSVKASTIVQLALQRDVPVIAYDRLVHDADLAYYVAFDNLKVGELQGQWIVDHALAGSRLAMFNGSDNDYSAQQLQRGAMNKIQPAIERGDIKLIYELYTPGWSGSVAAANAAQMLDTHVNDIQVIYAANDDIADAVIQVLAGRSLAGKVMVTGQDASAAGLRNIRSGIQAMTVLKNPEIQARNLVALITLLRRGETPSSLVNGSVSTSTGHAVQSVLAEPVPVDQRNANAVEDTLRELAAKR
jgi:D-xylose transport system substrate-binding protein